MARRRGTLFEDLCVASVLILAFSCLVLGNQQVDETATVNGENTTEHEVEEEEEHHGIHIVSWRFEELSAPVIISVFMLAVSILKVCEYLSCLFPFHSSLTFPFSFFFLLSLSLFLSFSHSDSPSHVNGLCTLDSVSVGENIKNGSLKRDSNEKRKLRRNKVVQIDVNHPRVQQIQNVLRGDGSKGMGAEGSSLNPDSIPRFLRRRPT